MSLINVLEQIILSKKERIQKEGYQQGIVLKKERVFPLVPFPQNPFVISEIKRSSPSAGQIDTIEDPVALASSYVENGSKVFSVLTEQDYFHGSLQDLIKVKKKFPHLAVLRKDFLLSKEDVLTSYYAGADAILLIASLLSSLELKKFYGYAKSLGMEVLVEVDSLEDIKKIAPFTPSLVGINSRNLRTFTIDRLKPLRLSSYIHWDCHKVYESGITNMATASLAFRNGFLALLVGQKAVEEPLFLKKLNQIALDFSHNPHFFSNFQKLYQKHQEKKGLFVKVCGITQIEDAKKAIDLGADMIGLVLAPSPRKVDFDFIHKIAPLPILKSVVTFNLNQDETLLEKLYTLWKERVIDFIQFHGEEPTNWLQNILFDFIKAVRVKDLSNIKEALKKDLPALLFDSFSLKEGVLGGSGELMDKPFMDFLLKQEKVWLAGGISPHFIQQEKNLHQVELFDLSSSLESSKGIKDHQKMEDFFKQIAILRSQRE